MTQIYSADEPFQRMNILRHQLTILLRQQASFGPSFVPPVVIFQIEEARAEIAHMKQAWRSVGITIEDQPDDIAPGNTGVTAGSSASLLELLFSQHRGMRPSEWRLFLDWIAATVVSWLSLGLLAGWWQGTALRRRLGPRSADVLPFWFCVITPVAILAIWVTVAMGAFAGAVGGAAIGAVQWLDLRRVDRKISLWRWLLANALAGGIAKSLFIGPAHELPWHFDLASVGLLLSVGAAAAVYGAITGIILVWMLHDLPDP